MGVQALFMGSPEGGCPACIMGAQLVGVQALFMRSPAGWCPDATPWGTQLVGVLTLRALLVGVKVLLLCVCCLSKPIMD